MEKKIMNRMVKEGFFWGLPSLSSGDRFPSVFPLQIDRFGEDWRPAADRSKSSGAEKGKESEGSRKERTG